MLWKIIIMIKFKKFIGGIQILILAVLNQFLSSLKQFPIQNFFIHKKNALDEINFKSLIEDHEIKYNI